MKQQVDITLKLSLWLDATMDEDAIVTHIRSSLPHAFGDELTEMKNPVDILDVREEAAIYANRKPGNPTRGPWAVYRLADDADTYGPNAGRLIVTTADWEVEITGPIENEADAHIIAAGPKLLEALYSLKEALTLRRHWKPDMPAHLISLIDAAVAEATGRAA